MNAVRVQTILTLFGDLQAHKELKHSVADIEAGLEVAEFPVVRTKHSRSVPWIDLHTISDWLE